MKTFVANDKSCDYTEYLVVIKAENIEEATKIFNKRFNFLASSDYRKTISKNIRELEDNELVYLVSCG